MLSYEEVRKLPVGTILYVRRTGKGYFNLNDERGESSHARGKEGIVIYTGLDRDGDLKFRVNDDDLHQYQSINKERLIEVLDIIGEV